MDTIQLEILVKLRTVVGYLGEREQYAWWKSSFFAPGNKAFLAPVFARTQMLAQCVGVTRAAALIHDEHIGRGNVYHLFRLPEDIEQGIHHALYDPELCAQIDVLVSSQENAMKFLQKDAGSLAGEGIGPVHVGNTQDLRNPGHWSVLAAHYARAFDSGSDVYPFFKDRV